MEDTAIRTECDKQLLQEMHSLLHELAQLQITVRSLKQSNDIYKYRANKAEEELLNGRQVFPSNIRQESV
jgi:hypothetical protein